MFRDGNNQAMQLVMQGYSDSIRAKTSNQGLAMANAFNQGLSNAVQTHDNHEQAMRNRALTDEQIQTAKHNNAYLADTHDTRVAQTHQQEMMNDLDIKFKSDTHDYRVGQEQQAERQMKLNNNYQAKLNEEQKLTSASRVNATNNQNYATSSQAKTSKKYSDMERANYEIENVYTDGKGNYYYNSKRTQAMDSATAEARMKRNAEKEQNRREYQNRFTSDNRQVVAGNQAQEAQNTFNMKMGDQQNKMYDEAKTSIQASGDTYDDIVYKLGEAARNNESQITLRNGTKMSVEMASMLGNGMLRGNSGGIGGGININHADKSTIRERDIDAAYNLYDDKDDPQARDRIAMQQKYKKEYGEISKSLESIGHFSQIMQDLDDKNRASLAIGSLTRFIGSGEDYVKFKAQNSITLASMAKQTFGGQISDRDMQIMREQTAKMWESTPATMARLEQTLANQISTLKGKIKGTPIGINIMTPEQQQQYIGLTQLYQAIMQGKKN
ncbi:hypothetical protein XJ32_07160 [Helicobacter bilis]|uniref:Uncharacterized protein n=1 Tax=Helicobacter bilis TaxID=37372 RepID=A0A1Q2LHE8_9HELI|nr:hypothetical protein [Helicobacter bilis]AQQ59900.1 hypothetical protein XJ32_07160 [Helicobacter bilis]